MIKKIPFDNTEIRFSDTGQGIALVLLHGYLESLEIWDNFVKTLPDDIRTICPDLPGHGKSGILGEVHTMEMLAESVIAVLDHCQIDKCFIAGHSMGGYSGLALLENYPERLRGLCLFHSHPFPDTKRTMNNRCREMVLVNQGKKELISMINIPRAFSKENLGDLKHEIIRATKIAISNPDEGINACLLGMMERPSRQEVLRETDIPVLVIAGKHDNYIPFDEVAKKIPLPGKSKFVTLENSGHIGFIEEPEESAKAIYSFIKSTI